MKYLAVAALLIAAPAAAQNQCLPTDQMVKLLGEAGEQRLGFALDNRNVIMELWAKPDNSTWTILMVGPRGLSCIADFGENWNVAPPVQPGEPS